MGASTRKRREAIAQEAEDMKCGRVRGSGCKKGGGHADADATDPLLGNILVVSAQIAAAFQFIVEEKVLSKYKIPANVAVGLEGFWGLGICAIALPVAFKVKRNGEPVDNFHEAAAQIGASRQLQVTTRTRPPIEPADGQGRGPNYSLAPP